jgi:putative phosphoribosyl transferase
MKFNTTAMRGIEIAMQLGDIKLGATLEIPKDARGLVVFVHGSGSSRFSPRNMHVAHYLNDAGLATLLMDLLTGREEEIDDQTLEYRFDIDLLSERVGGAVEWLKNNSQTRDLNIGLFGASTGAAAALVAAAQKPEFVGAVVSRGGRPDLAQDFLPRVKSPTLLIVGGNDTVVIALNEEASEMLICEHGLAIVPGASHLFEEPGKLDLVAQHAKNWFLKYLNP